MHRRLIAVMLLVPSIALASCGGGKDKSTSATTPTVSTVPAGPTGPTGSSKKNGKSGKRSKSGSKAKRRASTGVGRNLTPANSKKQAERVRKAIQRAQQKVKQQEKKALAVEKTVPQANKELNTTAEAYSAAKTVCGQFLPDTYIQGKNKTDIARDYSKPWPAKLRASAYKGCFEGLQQPRPHSEPAD
jgi:hypothetical protein